MEDSFIAIQVDTFRYSPESKKILKGFSLDIRKGKITGIMGENGCGKSTFLQMCAGDIHNTGISITSNVDPKEISFVHQDYRKSLFPWKTGTENLCLPPKIKGIDRNEYIQKLKNLVTDFDIGFDLNQLPKFLSGGEQQKISVLRALMESPKILLMDEPCSAMDYASRLIFLKQLREKLKASSTSVLFVSHTAEEALMFCDQIILMSDSGEISKKIDNCQLQEEYLKNIGWIHEHFLA